MSDKIILHKFYAKPAVAHVCKDPEQVSENWRFLMGGPSVLISQDSPGTHPLKYACSALLYKFTSTFLRRILAPNY